MARLLPHLALFLALLVGVTPAQKTEKHPELGLVVVRPSRYEARAIPPGEEALVLFYAPKDAPKDKVSPATLRVYKAAFRGDPAVAVERWVLDTFRPRRLEPERSVRERYGRKPHRFEGELVTDEGEVRELFVHAWAGPDDLVIAVGEGDSKTARRDRRQWERFADSMKFDRRAPIHIGGLDKMHTLVTDEGLPATAIDLCRQHDIRLETVARQPSNTTASERH